MTTGAETFVFGAGGHGRVVAEALRAAGRHVAGFLDDDPRVPGALGIPMVGGREWIERAGTRALRVALGIGDNRMRFEVLTWLAAREGVAIETVVHPHAWVSPSATLGAGSVVFAGAVVNAQAALGRACIVNSGAVVEHDVELGEGVHVSPRAALGGGVRVGRLSQVGMGAAVLPGRAVGAGALVGAGAVVVRDVADGLVVVGVPARVQGR